MRYWIAALLRWTARASALFLAGAFALLFYGDISTPQTGPPSQLREWIGMFLALTVCVGMLLAWRWELTGALLSLCALLAIWPMVGLEPWPVLATAAVPGVLYLMDWAVRRRQPGGHKPHPIG